MHWSLRKLCFAPQAGRPCWIACQPVPLKIWSITRQRPVTTGRIFFFFFWERGSSSVSSCCGFELLQLKASAKHQQCAFHGLMWGIQLTSLLFCEVSGGVMGQTGRQPANLAQVRLSCKYVNMSHRYPSSSPPENNIWIDGRSRWGLYVGSICWVQAGVQTKVCGQVWMCVYVCVWVSEKEWVWKVLLFYL